MGRERRVGRDGNSYLESPGEPGSVPSSVSSPRAFASCRESGQLHLASPLAVEDMRPGRLRAILVPSMAMRSLVHVACPVAASVPSSFHPRHAPPRSPRVSVVAPYRPRSIHAAATIRHLACPVAVEDTLPGRLRAILVPSARLRRFRSLARLWGPLPVRRCLLEDHFEGVARGRRVFRRVLIALRLDDESIHHGSSL